MQARKRGCVLALALVLASAGCSRPDPLPKMQPKLEVGDAMIVPGAGAEGRWSVGPLFSLQDGSLVLGDTKFSLRS